MPITKKVKLVPGGIEKKLTNIDSSW